MTPVLQAKNLCKGYEVGDEVITAVCNINLTINKGDFIAITGKSGSGKSTLMHMLGLLDTPTSGELILNGKNTKGMSERELAQVRNTDIGFVFQAFNLLQRTTVLENVMLPLIYSRIPNSEHEKIALEVIEQVGLSHRLKNKSNELSGGERQRVAIARALVNKPTLILADEPTGNLDPATSKEIMELLLAVAKEENTAILMATHDMQMVAHFPGRILEVKDAQVLEQH